MSGVPNRQPIANDVFHLGARLQKDVPALYIQRELLKSREAHIAEALGDILC
jgi:hypothetical protein